MGRSILVIEDDPFSLELMRCLLEARWHTVASARDGVEGLRRALAGDLDLVLCDIRLPGLSGLELVRRFRAHPALRRLPLVAVTAQAMAGDQDRILGQGFDGYLSKPIEPWTFVEQVESAIRRGVHPGPGPAVLGPAHG
jgi:two-component system cell cycle response regulator